MISVNIKKWGTVQDSSVCMLLSEVFNSVQKEMLKNSCYFLSFIWVGGSPSILCSYGHYCSVRAAASAILQVIFRYNQDPTW